MKPDITLIISGESPLSNQIKKITGDNYNVGDFEQIDGTRLIRHKATGLVIRSYNKEELLHIFKQQGMMSSGYVVGWPNPETRQKYEFYVDDDVNILHFKTSQEAMDAVSTIDAYDISGYVILYHIYCLHCGREHFLDWRQVIKAVREDHYYCSKCQNNYPFY